MAKGLLFFCVATACCFFYRATAQATGQFISGNGIPVPLVNVSLLQLPDSVQTAAVAADSNGRFRLLAGRTGQFLLRASATGFQTWYSASWRADTTATLSLGQISLTEVVRGLDAVVVRAARPPFEQQPGGLLVNPSASVMTKGSTLLAVLQRSPGVTLDPQTSGLSLNGKSGVSVALNGKILPLPMEEVIRWLGNINADEVERIELLNTPPSKYDAQGNAGIINIVMKKNRRPGNNGSISLTAGYGKWEKAGATLTFSHNTGKTSLNTSYSFSHDHSYNYLAGVSDQDFPPLGGQVNVQFNNNNKSRFESHNASLGFEYRPDSGTTVSTNFLFTGGGGDAGTINRRIITYHPDSALNFYSDIGSHRSSGNLVSSLSLEKKWSAKNRSVIGGDWIIFNSDAPTTASSDFRTPDGQQAGHNDTLFSPMHRGYAHTAIRVGVFSFDHSSRFSNELSLEAGLKGTHTGSNSQSGIESLVDGQWVGTAETSNNIRLNENIGAAYASLSVNPDRNSQFSAGLRYEYSRTQMHDPVTGGNNIDRRLGGFFPSFSFTQKWNDRESIVFSYSKRVTRPSYNDLSSFVAYNDPLSVFSGNPFLKPAITHNLKAGYSYRRLSFSLLASRDLHGIAEYQIVASPQQDIQVIAPQNLDWQNSLLLQATLPVKINPWLDMTQSIVGAWHRYHESYTEFPLSQTWYSLLLNGSFTARLPHNWSAELSGFYNTASYNGTVVTRAYWSLNGGLKKTMKGNGGTWQLSVADLLRSLKYRTAYGTLTKEAFDGSSHLVVETESVHFPVIKITYSRTFGGPGTGSKGEENKRSSEERGRIR